MPPASPAADYLNSRCKGYDVDTDSRTGRQRLEKDSAVNFFEKICLKGGEMTTMMMMF